MQRTVELTDEQVRELERLAAQERRTVNELVQMAVGDYLVRRRRDWSDWSRRFDGVVAEFRRDLPPGESPAAIEAEVTAARAEDHAERAATHGRRSGRAGSGANDAGGR